MKNKTLKVFFIIIGIICQLDGKYLLIKLNEEGKYSGCLLL
jgi:hypothetical protein